MKSYYCINETIEVTEHAVDKYLIRRKYEGLSREEVKKLIVNQVRQSVLIGIKNNEEHRSHKGFIFVVKREPNGLLDKLVVVTVKISKVRKKQFFSTDFSLDTVNREAIGCKKYVQTGERIAN